MVTVQELRAQAAALADSAKSEVDYRNVISLTYYCAFHAVTEMEESLPFKCQLTLPEKMGSHERLFQKLEVPHASLDASLARDGKKIAGAMRQFRSKREKATYQIDKHVLVSEMEAAIADMDDMLDECKHCAAAVKKLGTPAPGS